MLKKQIESSMHLYCPPSYQSDKGNWFIDFFDAVADCEGNLSWDVGAIMSVLAFNYPCGDRTLISQIKRKPWLSRLEQDGQCILEEIPRHGFIWKPIERIAQEFYQLLCEEALEACRGRKEIYLLLSGGLDSRIVAGLIAKLLAEGKIAAKVTAVTWGLPNSRDICYSRLTAETLGFKWLHIDNGKDDVFRNLNLSVDKLGCLIPSQHLHRMDWFSNVSPDALVLAGSYGDSIGRAEFSGKHLLELEPLRPFNPHGLIKGSVASYASRQIHSDLDVLHQRMHGEPEYARCEAQMQGHYMRGMIAHLMSVINNYCTIYQMFTHPKVYSYMWSLHPALRDNRVYAHVLEILDPKLARLPWARTNRALTGKTIGAQRGLGRNFDEYDKLVGGPLYDEIKKIVDPKWFEATGIFDGKAVKLIGDEAYSSQVGLIKPYSQWLWLAGFRMFAERLESVGKKVCCNECVLKDQLNDPYPKPCGRGVFRRLILSRSVHLNRVLRWGRKQYRKIHRLTLKHRSIKKYPPIVGD